MKIDRRALFGAAFAASATAACGRARAQNSEDAPLTRLAPPASGPIKVAFLVDRFHNIMDLAGAWETFGSAGTDEHPFELYTVSPVRETLSLGGVSMTADYLLDDAPQPHIISMGAQYAADGPSNNDAKSAWLRRVAPQADVVMSVCTGASVLARSGLIDGKRATTHHEYYNSFERDYPRVQLVRGRRWVDNGKFISAGGLTSGINSALHVVARYFGMEKAASVAVYLEHSSNEWRSGVRETA